MMRYIQQIYYTIPEYVTVCKPFEKSNTMHLRDIDNKLQNDLVEFIGAQLTRQQVNKIIADIIKQDFTPKNYMYIQYVFNKYIVYKKQRFSNKNYIMEGIHHSITIHKEEEFKIEE